MTDKIDLPGSLPEEGGPLVSVVIASYQADREYIKKALRSVAGQTYRNIEVVLVDSSRRTFLQKTAAATDWIRYRQQDPLGVSAGKNAGVESSEGEVIAVLDDDDYYAPERIERALDALNRGADIVYSDVYDIDEETGERSYREAMIPDDPNRLWKKLFRFDGRDGSIPAATVTFRAECVTEERFDEDLAGGEDYHLWVRLFREFTPAYVPEPLAYMRLRDDSLSADPDLMYENRLLAVEKLCDRYPDLAQYRDERRMLEQYDYGRHLLLQGRVSEARQTFAEVAQTYRSPRAAVMLAVSLLPAGHERVVHALDDLRDTVT